MLGIEIILRLINLFLNFTITCYSKIKYFDIDKNKDFKPVKYSIIKKSDKKIHDDFYF